MSSGKVLLGVLAFLVIPVLVGSAVIRVLAVSVAILAFLALADTLESADLVGIRE